MDNKKKIELTITGIGIVILIFLAASHLAGSKNNRPVEKPGSSAPLKFSIKAAHETKSGNDEKWGRDPFLSATSDTKERGMESMVLNGVVADKQNPYAIINNDVVKLGDKVNGMTVIEIDEKSVVLDDNGSKHTLELNVY